MTLDADAGSQGPSWMDHHYLNFWLWACLHNAEAYLRKSAEFREILLASSDNWREFHNRRVEAQNLMDLEKYHFVMTMGSLLRHLNRVAALFPAIQPAYHAAEHLRREGASLRNNIEHADQNFAAEKRGKSRSGFVRKSSAAANLPGDERGIADATSTIIDDDGHWLGGRLNVERVIVELRLLFEAVKNVPPPE